MPAAAALWACSTRNPYISNFQSAFPTRARRCIIAIGVKAMMRRAECPKYMPNVANDHHTF
jgi:hypothetical protein